MQNDAGKVVPDSSVKAGGTFILGGKDWNSVQVKKLSFQSESAELMTDNAIRGRDLSHLVDRDLTQVASSWLTPETATLDDKSSNGACGATCRVVYACQKCSSGSVTIECTNPSSSLHRPLFL